MARLVLCYPAWTGEYKLFGWFAKRNSRWPPLNLALLGAVCEQAGHEVIILDGEIMGWDKKRLAAETVALKPDIIGLTAYSPFFHLSADVATEIKRLNPDIPIIVGGPHVTIMKEKALLPQFDYGFMGEAERSLPEFLNYLSTDKYRSPSHIKGMLWRDLTKQVVNNGAAWLRDTAMRKSELGGQYPLDDIPLPARHLLPMEKYLLGTPNGRDHFTSIQTARGCPWQCLVAGTKILMYDGTYAKIESVKEGDRIICADLRKGVPSIGTITKTGSRIAEDIYRLKLSDGSQVDVTGDHPIWTKAGWRRVKGIQKGQQILSLSNLHENSVARKKNLAYLQLARMYQGTDSARETWRQKPDETPRGTRESWDNIERAAWPSIIGFHARQESSREDVARISPRSNAPFSQTQNLFSKKTKRITSSSVNFNTESHRIASRKFRTDDQKQSDAKTGSSRQAECYNEEITSGRQISPATSERNEQMREAVGQDFSPRETPGKICGLQEILDRSGTIEQETQSRFYSHYDQVETGDSLQREVSAQSGKYPRTQVRLYDARLERSPSLGRFASKKESDPATTNRKRISPRWLRITDIAFLGRGMVYTIAVDTYKNFFANNLLVHNCIFCASDKLKTTRYIMKSPRHVVGEMAGIANQFPFITHLYIVDDVLTFWPEHIIEICNRMDAEGLKFTFESSTRANLVNDKLIERLAKSGLIRLSFGLETIDPVMRVTMQKKVPIEAYAVANKICTKYGVEAMNSLMIGLPGETKESIQRTLEWVAAQRDIKQANLAIAIPYPGTEFHEMAVSGNYGVELLSQDFAEYLRYGNAVTNVGNLTAQDLIDKQNEGFVMIYSKPWRWLPVLRKHGIIGFLMQTIRVFRMWRKMFLKWSPFQPLMKYPKEI